MTTMLARDTKFGAALAAAVILTGASMAAQAQTATAALSAPATTAASPTRAATAAVTPPSAHAELETLRQLHPHPVVLPLHPPVLREEQALTPNVRVYVSMTRQPERDRSAFGG